MAQRKHKEVCSTHDPFDPIDEMHDVEVQQQPDANTAQLQIGKHLRRMNIGEAFHRFHFDEHLLLDAQVDAIRRIDCDAVVHDRQFDFGVDLKAGLFELVKQTSMVRFLEQPGAQGRVHLESATENSPGDLVYLKFSLFFLLSLCGRGQRSIVAGRIS